MTAQPQAVQQAAFVTGGCGFLGSHLVERLVADGATVTVLDNLDGGRAENLSAVREAITVIEGDVRRRDDVEDAVRRSNPDVVYHLAANASVPGSVEDPAHDFEANAVGTFVLLDVLHALEAQPETGL